MEMTIAGNQKLVQRIQNLMFVIIIINVIIIKPHLYTCSSLYI